MVKIPSFVHNLLKDLKSTSCTFASPESLWFPLFSPLPGRLDFSLQVLQYLAAVWHPFGRDPSYTFLHPYLHTVLTSTPCVEVCPHSYTRFRSLCMSSSLKEPHEAHVPTWRTADSNFSSFLWWTVSRMKVPALSYLGAQACHRVWRFTAVISACGSRGRNIRSSGSSLPT